MRTSCYEGGGTPPGKNEASGCHSGTSVRVRDQSRDGRARSDIARGGGDERCSLADVSWLCPLFVRRIVRMRARELRGVEVAHSLSIACTEYV